MRPFSSHILSLAAIICSFSFTGVSAAVTCDQTFPSEVLRYGYQYDFNDTFINPDDYEKYLLSFTPTFTEAYDYNLGVDPVFDWTSNIKAADWTVYPNTSPKVITTTSKYKILSVPPVRSPSNLLLTYSINYEYESYAGSNVWRNKTHVECQPYEISWCGDGVVDGKYGESCDSGSANGQAGKCNASCTAIIPNPPAPVCRNGIKEGTESCDDGTNNGKPGMCNNSCSGFTPNPINGVCGSDNGKSLSATPVSLCSVGVASTVTGSGPWSWSCAGSNSGTTASCSATKSPSCGDGIKNGSEICDPADSSKVGWGTMGCDNSCNPISTPNPVCDASKTGVQTSPLTEGYCTVGSPISFTSTFSGSTRNYTWNCKNAEKSLSCAAQYTVPPVCDDGIKNGSETCDDGSGNGQPGKCNISCSGITVNNSCDQTFTGTLRYGKKYSFSDDFINPTANPYLITNFSYTAEEQNDYNGSALFPEFTWSPELVSKGYIVDGNSSITAVKSKSGQTYDISYYPAVRSFDNLKLKYVFQYYQGSMGPYTHNECVNYEISRCGDGIKDTIEGEQCDPADPSKSGWGTEGCDNTCKPLNTVVTPVCNPAATGIQTAPLTVGSCAVGTASGFTSTVFGPTTNYTWSCNTATAVSCSASYTPSISNAFDLRIKKYAKSEDIFASVDNTENFNYTIVVENVGTGKTSGVTTVTDKLPPSVTLRATPSGNDWTCTGNNGDTSFTCTTSAVVDAHQLFNVITVPTKVTNLVFRPDGYVNYAYVQNPNEADGKQCNANNSMPNPALAGNNGQDPTNVCNEDKNNFDPATINPPNPNGFDLRVKKFVKADDNSAPVVPGSIVDYTFILQNLGELASTGRTTVTDQDFPAGITIDSIATTQGEWTCVKDTSTKFTCISDKSYAKGEYATTILVKAKIPATLVVGSYRNIVCLMNPNDPNNGQVFDPDTGKYIVNNCDPAVVVVVDPSTFDLALKKYVADITSGSPQRDGDHQTSNDGTDVDRDILTVAQGGKVRYRFVVTNLGPVTATGTTTVEDTLPNDVSITSVSGTGWNCTQDGNRKFKCTRTENLVMGASFPQIVVDAQTSATILAGEYSNTATLSNPGDTNPKNNQDPANIQIVLPGFDLSVKKYVNTDANDAQDSASAVSTTTNALINYVIRVKNNGPLSTSGATTVKDVLPTGVTASGSASGTGWFCSYSGAELTCITSQVVASGAVFSDITVPVKVTLGEGQSVTNYVVVYNTDETNACKADGSMPVGNETSCGKDPKNIDPAVIKVPTTVCTSGCGTGVPLYRGPSCINGVTACTVDTYSSAAACKSMNGGVDCYADAASCNVAKSSLSCGGGTSSCTPGTVGCPNSASGRCGDGSPQPAGADGVAGNADDEECDLGSGNSNGAGSACTTSCKSTIFTNPGENPIADIWMTIPTLSRTRLGTSWLDGIPGKVSFSANRMVVGKENKLFNLADTVGFGIKSNIRVPYIIEYNKIICLYGTGSNITGSEICTTFGRYATESGLDTFETFNNVKYVVVGQGEYQIRSFATGPYVTYNTSPGNKNSITFFKGATQYPVAGTTAGGPTLNSNFVANSAIGAGTITLVNGSITQDPTGAIPMVSLDVRSAGPMLGSTTSVINRSVESYLKPTSALETFLSGFTREVSGKTAAAGSTTSTTNNPTVNVPSVSLASILTINNANDLLPYNLNGNKNIFSVKGKNVTIGTAGTNCSFMIDDIKTLIVQDADLIINCNIAYSPNTGASWAFIVKNGNIIVDKSVTNLAGVYVAIGDVSNTGLFQGNGATNAILKVDGSMYGNAKPLFESRLYVRGTSAYDILTTGVIMGYSNRALVNPPPLLSEYLNNYSVTKVAK